MRRFAVLLTMVVVSVIVVAILARRETNMVTPASAPQTLQSKSPIIEAVENAATQVRVAGVKALAAAGPSSIPALIRIAWNEDEDIPVVVTAMEAIYSFDPALSIPPLIRWAIDTEHPDFRAEGLELIESLCDFSELQALWDVDVALAKLAESDDADARIYAAYVLACRGTDTPSAFPALIDACEDRNLYVRVVAICALAQFECASDNVPSVLIRSLTDPDWRIRSTSATCLAYWAPKSMVAVPTLIWLLDDPHTSVRVNAALALGAFGPDLKEAVPPLIKLLGTSDRKTCATAAIALSEFGNRSSPAIPRLIELLDSKDANVQYSAAYALSDIDGMRESAIPRLTELLKSPDLDVRREAEFALESIAQAAIAEHRPQKLLDDDAR